MRVDLVIPFFNEEENLQILVKELNKIIPLLKNDFKIIFVNDGSSDGLKKS